MSTEPKTSTPQEGNELSPEELEGVSGGVKKEPPPTTPSPHPLPPDKRRDIAHDM